jgi:hypothetical protein
VVAGVEGGDREALAAELVQNRGERARVRIRKGDMAVRRAE